MAAITKICRICGLEKDASEFRLRSASKDGLASYCKPCVHKKSVDWKKANPDRIKELDRKCNKKRYQTNPEYFKAHNKKYIEQNKEKHKVSHKAANKKHRENNPQFYVEKEARHRACKQQAMPKWLTEEQLQQIKDIYLNCPDGFHVDHVHPLNGETVCGLHVPWNLQYLTAEENIKKSNKLLEI